MATSATIDGEEEQHEKRLARKRDRRGRDRGDARVRLAWKIILQGVDPQHMVENVIFDNVSCFGKLVTADSVGVNIGAHTRNVVFKGDR